MSRKGAYWPRKFSKNQKTLPTYVTPHKERQAKKAAESKARARRRAERRKGVRAARIDAALLDDISGPVEAARRGLFDHKKMEPNR
jgi:hypothetical protein